MQCRLCRTENIIEFLDLGRQPLAIKYPTKEEFATEEFYPLKMYFCPTCKCVQIDTNISRETMFEDYYHLSSVNAGVVAHYEEFAKTKLKDAKFVVDIGSNDGVLLKPLKEMGVKAIGVEPAINVAKLANEAGFETITAFFDSKTAYDIVAKYGRSDVAIGFSMFSHLGDPHTFIQDLKELLTEDGKFVLEIEYVDTVLKDMRFERFYLDRISYFSVTSLEKLFRQHGMYLSDVEETPSHGGSLRATFEFEGKGAPQSENVVQHLAYEAEKLTPERVITFGEEARAQIKELRETLAKLKADGVKVAGFASPARLSTICNFGNIGPDLIEFVVDETPIKQYKYTPGTHIPIVPMSYLDDHRPDIFVVFVHDYFEQVKKKLSGPYRYLFPVPVKEVQ